MLLSSSGGDITSTLFYEHERSIWTFILEYLLDVEILKLKSLVNENSDEIKIRDKIENSNQHLTDSGHQYNMRRIKILFLDQ